ncbi:hypothetical protein L2C96_33725 [Amycolatopsis tucumanensis]|nr:hypothetical protein [Amycolatopsis tucumanensis]MCF6427235.1 hypothetical protein [Amycolatopsis tucumanensis]
MRSATTTDLPTSPSSASNSRSPDRSPNPHTRSSVSRSTEAGKTAIRAHSRRSSGAHRSWLQSISARSDRCRGPAAGSVPASRWNRRSRRRTTSDTDNDRNRTAASSIASGSPSRRRHSATTAARFSGVTAKSGSTARARSTSSWTAGTWSRAPVPAASLSSGTASGASRCTRSPPMPSGSRLVARTRRPGSASSSRSTSRAVASRTCSQLSRTSSVLVPERWSTTRSTASRLDWSGTPIAVATVGATWVSCVTLASSTTRTPPGRLVRSAAVIAVRVLPTPPGPVTVTSRWARSSASSCAKVWRRPTKLVSATAGCRSPPPAPSPMTPPITRPPLDIAAPTVGHAGVPGTAMGWAMG